MFPFLFSALWLLLFNPWFSAGLLPPPAASSPAASLRGRLRGSGIVIIGSLTLPLATNWFQTSTPIYPFTLAVSRGCVSDGLRRSSPHSSELKTKTSTHPNLGVHLGGTELPIRDREVLNLYLWNSNPGRPGPEATNLSFLSEWYRLYHCPMD